jgi:uncharacterized membrane protein
MKSLGRQPFFQLLGAILVLLLTDIRPGYGMIALLVWASWIFWSRADRLVKSYH